MPMFSLKCVSLSNYLSITAIKDENVFKNHRCEVFRPIRNQIQNSLENGFSLSIQGGKKRMNRVAN
jgi:hypothetical protein